LNALVACHPMKKFTYYKCFAVATSLLLLCVHARSQDSLADAYTDISKVEYVTYMSKRASSAFISKKDVLADVLPSLTFKKGMTFTGNVPGTHVTKKPVLRFHVCNTSDSTASVWFFPGFFYADVRLYSLESDRLQPLPSITPDVKDNLGYRQISLPAHDSAIIYAELRFIKTYINSMRPRLIQPKRLNAIMADMRNPHVESHMITYVFCGLLLMMILFSTANYLQGANREYLYYSGYALFVGGMLFTKALYDFYSNTTSYFFESYLDFIMQCIGHGCYMFFMKEFLAARTRHRFLHRLYNFGVIMLVVSMVVYSFLHYFTDNYVAEYWTENATKFILLGMTLAFMIYSIRKWDDRLLRYIFWGNLCLFIFSLLSQVSVMIENRLLPGVFGSSLFYYEMGLFLELVFFLAGLNHKNRQLIIEQTKERERLRTENQMKEYEKEIAVYKAQQEERQRISADMHDELGAGMTAIRLMSEIARNKMKESTPVEIEKISHSADEVLNKMNAIIWCMNSGNDTLDNLVSYIRSYALEYFEGTPVECKVTTPRKIEPTELSGDKRRNVFLCVKETLNNALKHSGASEIKIEFEINHSLVIRISDNGVGIDMQRIRQFGNGLKNISRRMESIGGTYRIENNKGTVTLLVLPLS
jgi:signal transduction histidine kinase